MYAEGGGERERERQGLKFIFFSFREPQDQEDAALATQRDSLTMAVVYHAALFPNEHRSNGDRQSAEIPFPPETAFRLFLLLGSALLLQHLLDDLLLLNEECSDDTVPHAVSAP